MKKALLGMVLMATCTLAFGKSQAAREQELVGTWRCNIDHQYTDFHQKTNYIITLKQDNSYQTEGTQHISKDKTIIQTKFTDRGTWELENNRARYIEISRVANIEFLPSSYIADTDKTWAANIKTQLTNAFTRTEKDKPEISYFHNSLVNGDEWKTTFSPDEIVLHCIRQK